MCLPVEGAINIFISVKVKKQAKIDNENELLEIDVYIDRCINRCTA